MGYNTELAALAREDLLSAAEYLSKFYTDTASKALDEIWKRIIALEGNPLMYECYERNPYFRRIVAANYIVFYHVDETEQLVTINRVLRASRNVAQYLKDNKRTPLV